jgi:hypothetical protein
VQWLMTGAGTPDAVPSTPSKGRGDLSWWLTDELTDGEAIRAARIKQTDAWLACSLRIGVQAATRASGQAVLGRIFGQLRGQNTSGVLMVQRWWLSPRSAARRLRRLVLRV